MLQNPFTGETLNVYCAKGKGGGKDPTCKKGGGLYPIAVGGRKNHPRAAKVVAEALASLPDTVKASLEERRVAVDVVGPNSPVLEGYSGLYSSQEKQIYVGAAKGGPQADRFVEGLTYHEAAHAYDDGDRSTPGTSLFLPGRARFSTKMPLARKRLGRLLAHYEPRSERFAEAFAVAMLLEKRGKLPKNSLIGLFASQCPKEVKFCQELLKKQGKRK